MTMRCKVDIAASLIRDTLVELQSVLFDPDVRLTLIARLPGDDEADLVVTSDDLDEVASVIARSFSRKVMQ